MSDLDDEVSFQCPYCASPLSLPVDASGGSRQSFTTDCEVCCHPIAVTLEIDDDGAVELTAERES